VEIYEEKGCCEVVYMEMMYEDTIVATIDKSSLSNLKKKKKKKHKTEGRR